jgi:hypothetical protein
MEEYETVDKKGIIEKRVYIDSGRFVIYGYERGGKLSNKSRIMLSGKEKKSFFLISTGKGRNLTVDAEFEADIRILKEGISTKLSDLL